MSTDVTAKTPAPAPPGKSGGAAGDGLLQLVLEGLRRNMRQYGMLIALGLIVVLFAVWTDGDLLLPRNVSNLVLQNSYILILAIGMMLVIIAGHIDLSVGSLTAFIGSMAAVFMVKNDLPWPVAVILCLAMGALMRRGTRVLHRVRRNTILHRDPRGHADLPRSHRDLPGGPDPRPVPGGPAEGRQRLPARGRTEHELPQPHSAARLRDDRLRGLPGVPGPPCGSRSSPWTSRPSSCSC